MAGVTKINLKNLKTYLWLDDLIQETIWRHQLHRDGRFKPLANSGRSLTWAYKLKAKMLMHDYRGGGRDWPYDDISENNFFHKVK